MLGYCGNLRDKERIIMKNTVEQFIAQCDRFFASKEGREACTGRSSWLVEVEKLRGETFARCARNAMEDSSSDIRVMIECGDVMLPVVCAKVVDTAMARIPYLFRRQQWNPFKKHESVLVLLADKSITSASSAMLLSDLGKAYEEAELPPFDPHLPWVGVGMPETVASNSENKFDLNLGYKVESVRFNAADSCLVVKAVDFSDEIMFSV